MATLFEPVPIEFVCKTETYDYKTPISQTLSKVKKNCAVVVTRDGEYYGIVDDRSVFRKRSLKPVNFAKSFAIGKFAKKLPIIDSGTSLSTLIEYFHEYSAKALPYQEGKKITGIVTRDMVMKTILSTHMISKSRVNDVMTSPLVAIDSQANMAQAQSAMEKHKIARLVVLENGKIAGLLSMRDMFDRFTNPQERMPELKTVSFSLANIPVKSMMKTSVFTIDYDMPADSVIREFLEKKISSLVVTRSNRPVGVVTVRDIIEAAAAMTAKTQSKIIITGLDDYTKEYEDEIKSSINRMIEKVDKFERLSVDYVSVNIKRSRERTYEMNGRLSLQKKGTIFSRATGFSMESTLKSLLDVFYKRLSTRKDTLVTDKRGAERYYGE
jgi:CBS domain-containing protein